MGDVLVREDQAPDSRCLPADILIVIRSLEPESSFQFDPAGTERVARIPSGDAADLTVVERTVIFRILDLAGDGKLAADLGGALGAPHLKASGVQPVEFQKELHLREGDIRRDGALDHFEGLARRKQNFRADVERVDRRKEFRCDFVILRDRGERLVRPHLVFFPEDVFSRLIEDTVGEPVERLIDQFPVGGSQFGIMLVKDIVQAEECRRNGAGPFAAGDQGGDPFVQIVLRRDDDNFFPSRLGKAGAVGGERFARQGVLFLDVVDRFKRRCLRTGLFAVRTFEPLFLSRTPNNRVG